MLALLGGGAYAAWRVATQESSTTMSVGEAVGRFRKGARELPPALRGRAPLPGAYVYATRGFEEIDAFGGRRHRYPPRTTITVQPGGCGLRTRWDALATRWDATETCPRGAGWRLASTSEQHEFAGSRDRRTDRCIAASVALPARRAPGTRWTSRCTFENTVTASAGVVVGRRSLRVGGERVETLLVRVLARVSGDSVGRELTFTWLLPRSGLVVRRVAARESVTGTFLGDVRYIERVTLMLTSLTPRR